MFKKVYWTFIFFVILPNSLIHGQNYDLYKVFSEVNFYNVIYHQKAILISSNEGVFEFKSGGELSLFNKNIKTPIDNNLKEISITSINRSRDWNHLMPKGYNFEYLNGLKTDNYLFIISRGTLFVFRPTFYDFELYNSVRSISENYVGSYQGIFKSNYQLPYPQFTDGYIRELNLLDFICYGGLLAIDKVTNRTVDYSSIKTGQFSVNGNLYGYAYDVIEINHPEYLVLTSIGDVRFNIQEESASFIDISKSPDYSTSSRYDHFVYKEYSRRGKNILLYNEDVYRRYNIESKVFDTIMKFNETVQSLAYNKYVNDIFVLERNTNKVYNFNIRDNANSKKIISSLISSHNNDPHSLFTVENYLFVSGNKGLDIVDIVSGKVHRSVINEELNNGAFFIKQDSIFIGGLSGVFKMNLSGLFDFTQNSKDDDSAKVNFGFGLIELLFTLIATLILVILYLILKIKPLNLVKNDFKMENEIKLYIDQNLPNVTIVKLLDVFNISNAELYKAMRNEKPGHYIRTKRLEKLKEAKLNSKSIEEASSLTGFSISYLKKIYT